MALSVASSKATTIFLTLAMPLKGKGGKRRYTKSLLDQCSRRTSALRDTLLSVQYDEQEDSVLKIKGFENSHKYDVVSLKHKYRSKQYSIQAIVVDKVSQHKITKPGCLATKAEKVQDTN